MALILDGNFERAAYVYVYVDLFKAFVKIDEIKCEFEIILKEIFFTRAQCVQSYHLT